MQKRLQTIIKNVLSVYSSLLSLLIVVMVSLPGYCSQEVDFRASLVGGTGSEGNGALKYWDQGLSLFYNGVIPMNETFQFIATTQLDGYSQPSSAQTPLQQINHRQNEVVYLGVDYTDKITIQLRNYYHLLNNSKLIGFPIEYRTADENESSNMYQVGFMQQRYKTGADLLVSIPVYNLTAKADILYNVLNYDYSDYGMALPNMTDADLWIDASVGYNFLDGKIGLFVKGLQKHDLNEYAGYNWTKLFAGISTDLPLLKRRVLLSGNVAVRHNESRAMWLKGYIGNDKGYGIESHLRGIWQFARLTYLKGDAIVDISAITTKTRYALSIRKVLRNSTSFEGGYWISQGALVPRMCGYLQSDLEFIPSLSIMPAVKYFWLWSGEEQKKYTYYRTDLELALEYSIVSNKQQSPRNIACQCGVQYHLYDKKFDLNASTLQMFLGMKMNI